MQGKFNSMLYILMSGLLLISCRASKSIITYPDGITEINLQRKAFKKFHRSFKDIYMTYDSLGFLIRKEVTFYDNSQDWSAYGMPVIQKKTYTYINGSLHEKNVETGFWLWRKRKTKRGFHTLEKD